MQMVKQPKNKIMLRTIKDAPQFIAGVER